MMEADESQQLRFKKMLVMMLLTVGLSLGLMTTRVAAREVFDAQPLVLTTSDDRGEMPAGKRHQFRAKLLRNWWQVRQPKYVIYRPLFYKR